MADLLLKNSRKTECGAKQFLTRLGGARRTLCASRRIRPQNPKRANGGGTSRKSEMLAAARSCRPSSVHHYRRSRRENDSGFFLTPER
jgi:hypothetical protein